MSTTGRDDPVTQRHPVATAGATTTRQRSGARARWWAGRVVAVAVTLTVAAATGAGDAAAGQPVPAERPVLLVGGTGALSAQMDTITFLDDTHDVHTMTLSPWIGLDRALRLPPLLALDASVSSSLVGMNGAASMATSAEAVGREVDRVLAETGAERIDVVGHSLAAPVIRHYVKFLGGADTVAGVVSLGGVNYGIPRSGGALLGDAVLSVGCTLGAPVCDEIVYDGELGDTPFLRALNEPDPTPGDIDYYHLWTSTDESPGGTLPGAVNVRVQDMCPGRAVYHAGEWDDAAMQVLIEAALARLLEPDALPPCPG